MALPGVRVAWLGWHHLFTWLMCHVWHAYRTLRRPPGSCATRGLYAAHSAPCLAHVPPVACTPQAPQPAWSMCHTWHARRTLRRPPGACATRGMHTARSACATRGMYFSTPPEFSALSAASPHPLFSRASHRPTSACCPKLARSLWIARTQMDRLALLRGDTSSSSDNNHHGSGSPSGGSSSALSVQSLPSCFGGSHSDGQSSDPSHVSVLSWSSAEFSTVALPLGLSPDQADSDRRSPGSGGSGGSSNRSPLCSSDSDTIPSLLDLPLGSPSHSAPGSEHSNDADGHVRAMPPAPPPRATRGTPTARSALSLAQVPRVASTPHRRPFTRRTCHAWHVRRTLRPLPDACATRGIHTARAAQSPVHVPRVASHRTRLFFTQCVKDVIYPWCEQLRQLILLKPTPNRPKCVACIVVGLGTGISL